MYLVDAELALEATADSVVQWDLHGVVDVTHFMSAHLILDVKADHCGGQREQSLTPMSPGDQPTSAEALLALQEHDAQEPQATREVSQ